MPAAAPEQHRVPATEPDSPGAAAPLSRHLGTKVKISAAIKNKDSADIVLSDWFRQAAESGVSLLQGMADTIEKHRDGILAWYDYRTSTGKIEGINIKIKTMKRQAYGFRDMEFFKLKIFALHDSTYAFSG